MSPTPLYQAQTSLRPCRRPSSETTEETSSTIQLPKPNVPTSGTLRIFSWNVNGIAPFIERRTQKIITAFFKSTSASPTGKASEGPAGRKRKRSNGGTVLSDSDSHKQGYNDKWQGAKFREGDLSTSRNASLRLIMQSYGWPQVLCLQEVKIRDGDTRTMDAMRLAVNDPIGHPEDDRSQQDQADKALGNILTDGGPLYDVDFSLPSDPYNARGFGGKVYGVATVIQRVFTQKYVTAARGLSWDREGQVHVIETGDLAFPLLSGTRIDPRIPSSSSSKEHASIASSTVKAGSRYTALKMAILNIYAVNGTTNPYNDTHTGTMAGTRHDRKLAFHYDLLREAKTLEARGFRVILAGDMNVARDERDGHPRLRTWPRQHVRNREDFEDKFFSSIAIRALGVPAEVRRAMYDLGDGSVVNREEDVSGFDGIDTFRYLHGDERRYSYHPRGVDWGSSCDRVDMVIASRALEEMVAGAGICDSLRDRGPSDHCPVWVEIGHTGTE
ncbi:Endonuclease/exonuclease/phosphatase [Xylariaceae sp. FL0016]|nr:Endonuclease/exonuclease/phosphatase [Xylariaceae sp. FL0016]